MVLFTVKVYEILYEKMEWIGLEYMYLIWIHFKILEGEAWFHIDMNLSNLLDTSGNYIEKKVVVYA